MGVPEIVPLESIETPEGNAGDTEKLPMAPPVFVTTALEIADCILTL